MLSLQAAADLPRAASFSRWLGGTAISPMNSLEPETEWTISEDPTWCGQAIPGRCLSVNRESDLWATRQPHSQSRPALSVSYSGIANVPSSVNVAVHEKTNTGQRLIVAFAQPIAVGIEPSLGLAQPHTINQRSLL